jgi:peptidoglycan-associated lipoprotein
MFKSDTVHFAFDSSVIRPEENSKVANVANYLKANSANAVKVEGHCDERGTEEYNRALGERRALALREMLVGLGIEPDRVDTLSYGKDRPEDPGHDESAWRVNRRGVFVLLSPPK